MLPKPVQSTLERPVFLGLNTFIRNSDLSLWSNRMVGPLSLHALELGRKALVG